MKVFLAALVLAISACGSYGQIGNNYLTRAFDSAMAHKANFDYNANYYREYLDYETTAMSRNLIELAAQAQERVSTAEQGNAIRACAVVAAYQASGLGNPVLDKLNTIEDGARIYFKIIYEEMNKMNLFDTDFDVFQSEFQMRLNESYEHLNDVLLQDVLDAIFDFMDGSRLVYSKLEDCLGQVGM